MATGWGVSPDENGNGTTPEDIQRILGAQYRNSGIIERAVVTGTATMSYAVSEGAVLVDTGPGMAVIVPVTPTTVPTDPAPATGERIDTLWVKQNFPGTDGSSLAYVGITKGGTTVPARAVFIGQFRVRAGITATSAAIPIGNRRFAVQSGASVGRLYQFAGTPGTGPVSNAVATHGAGTFYVPQDCDVEVKLSTTIYAVKADGTPDPTGSGSVMFRIFIDGQQKVAYEREYGRIAETVEWSPVFFVSEGQHTIHYTTERNLHLSGAGHWKALKGGADKFSGDVLSVWDRGVVTN